ncbi:hypothetical protein [Streptomyces milbemycinicus]|uniref:Uncharacterized protein n=1 Tax=Streptomyces milbemycinicus TaxID=476552 RepID=A0ABW8M8C9_9ACTN
MEHGWFSEYYGGAELLEDVPGVLDGSPKNGHYPFNPEQRNIGHTQGWVAFNTAWNESLAWQAADQTELKVSTRGRVPARVVQVDTQVRIDLAAPLNLDADTLGQGTVDVRVGDRVTKQVTVTQTEKNSMTKAEGARAADDLLERPGERPEALLFANNDDTFTVDTAHFTPRNTRDG